MSATHGLASRLLKRGRLLGLALVAVFAMSAVTVSSASALPMNTEHYVALGDSLAFGYSQQLFNEHLGTGEPAAAFTHGYADDYLLHLHPKLTGITLQDLGCPGETSGSLIGNGPLEAGLKAGQELEEGKAVEPFGEAPCAYHELAAEANGFPAGFKFPLHTEYGGAGVSQLEAALGVIAHDAAEGKPATHVSLNIGANDQLHFVTHCEQKVGEEVAKGEIEPTKEAEEKAFHFCLVSGALPLGNKIGTNIARILTVIRDGSAFGGVNYGGPIIFVGAYNPYGNVFKIATKVEAGEGKNYELLAGSNGLAATFNAGFGGVAAKFGGCLANTLTKFNPQNFTEPNKLQKWTNMANFSETEFPPTSGHKLKNGPDIHATPEGYKIMSNVMTASCG
jgi:lysophospholipase L1-like esterase